MQTSVYLGRRAAALIILMLFLSPGGALANLLSSVEAHIPTRTIVDPLATAARLAGQAEGLKQSVAEHALQAYQDAQQQGYVRRSRLAIIDYSLPSNQKRLWVFDLESERLLFYEWVAHGLNTGLREARDFSNRLGSKQSSLGAFVTMDTYYGGHGYSLKLVGVSPGLNDLAMRRRIVVHGAWYVGARIVNEYGRLGRSWGCPAVRPQISRALIDTVKNGSVLFVYHPKLEKTAQHI